MNHHGMMRENLLGKFVAWLGRHGAAPKRGTPINGGSPQQEPASNDCGFYVLNSMILELTGIRGEISRTQVKDQSWTF